MEKIIVNNYTLDEEQLKPIIENEKFSIIIAGAGSGKSLTLVGKVKYLQEKNLFKPEEICCISFTNESTENLKKNIINNCNQEVPTFTFHKLALSILKKGKIPYKIAPADLLQYTIEEFFYSHCFHNEILINCVYKYFKYIIKTEENWQKILNSYQFEQTKKIIITFINLFKCNGNKIEDFVNFFSTKKDKNLLLIIYAIYLIYETEKKSSGTIDFDDMIILAKTILHTRKCDIPYKMIIIDEFQDTSTCRFNLIKEIISINNGSLCVVGDDYQSIYHFSGCDLNLFLNFNTIFPNAKTYKLQKTYRNSQELISVAGNFIQKNPEQIKKELVSEKHLKKPIKLSYYQNEHNILEKIIKKIPPNKSILILGRNNFDIKKYTQKLTYEITKTNEIHFKKFPKYNIRYLTIHSSKGLECDIVILLNLSNAKYGFPSKKTDEQILKHVKKGLNYPFEEERRLFYVALTRTKEIIFILIPEKNPSKFMKEIKYNKNVERNHY